MQDGAGTDTITSTISRSLAGHAAIEKLILLSGSDGTGNALANTITGNAAANLLDGGAGTDTMIGLGGNDTYVVGIAGDVTIEGVNAGIDTVRSSVTRTLGANLENLTLTGSAIINATGNTLANVLVGNAANNVLNGGLGKDTQTGGAGHDKFVYKTAADSRGTTVDLVTDFDDVGIDRIDLSAIVSGTLTYIGAAAFTGARQVHIRDINGPDVLVEVNLGGSLTSVEFAIRLKVTALASMTAGDFLL